jgi:hypothetical protein
LADFQPALWGFCGGADKNSNERRIEDGQVSAQLTWMALDEVARQDGSKFPGFSIANAGIFDANVLLALQSASGAIQFR